MKDINHWTDLDYERQSDWFASLTPWQFVAYLNTVDRQAAQEYVRDTACGTIEVDGKQLTVRRDQRPQLTADGVWVPVEEPLNFVFVPTPRFGGIVV